MFPVTVQQLEGRVQTWLCWDNGRLFFGMNLSQPNSHLPWNIHSSTSQTIKTNISCLCRRRGTLIESKDSPLAGASPGKGKWDFTTQKIIAGANELNNVLCWRDEHLIAQNQEGKIFIWLPAFDFSKAVTITAVGFGAGVTGRVHKCQNPQSSLPAAEQTVLSLLYYLMSPFWQSTCCFSFILILWISD